MDQPLSQQTVTARRRRTLGIALAMLATVCAAAWGINRAVRPGVALKDIAVAEVRRGAIANTINASGIVIPVHEEFVTSPIPTRIAKVHAKAGQKVALGELLLELDDQSIKLAIDSLKEQLAQQDNRIVGLTLEMDQKRRQLTSSIELLELDLRAAKVKWGRYETLRKSGAVSGEDMLQAELNVQRVEIQLRQQRESIGGNERSTQSSIEGAKLQRSILSKQLVQQQQQLAQTQVRAPFAGMLTTLVADEGASIAAGQVVAKVSELNNYRVEASVSDFHARSLKQRQIVRVEQGSTQLTGQVHTILPEIQNGSIKLLVSLDQPNHAMLRDKMRVDVNVVTDHKADALVVNMGPAFNGKGRQPVFVVRGSVARKTEVDLGSGDGKAVELLAGAQLGDRIIISDTKRFIEHDSIAISK
jgi:HlyD family secretion protein